MQSLHLILAIILFIMIAIDYYVISEGNKAGKAWRIFSFIMAILNLIAAFTFTF